MTPCMKWRGTKQVTVDGKEIALDPGTYTDEIKVMPAEVPASGDTGASGEAQEDVVVQSFGLYPMDGYAKTFAGYIDWVCDALASQPGNPNLEREIATVRATAEDAYDPEAMPFSMQIRFGLICSYEDFLG